MLAEARDAFGKQTNSQGDLPWTEQVPPSVFHRAAKKEKKKGTFFFTDIFEWNER